MDPVNITQVLNPQFLSLNCSFGGFPLPIVNWITTKSDGSYSVFNNTMPTIDEDGRILVISSAPGYNTVTSTLTINSTCAADTANYTCMATNRLGSQNSTSSMVFVYGKNCTKGRLFHCSSITKCSSNAYVGLTQTSTHINTLSCTQD